MSKKKPAAAAPVPTAAETPVRVVHNAREGVVGNITVILDNIPDAECEDLKALMAAIGGNDEPKLKALLRDESTHKLVDRRIPLAIQPPHTMNLLQLAITSPNKPSKGMVALLIRAGATLDSKNENGLTPLHFAVRAGREDIVELLLSRGAKPDAVTKEGTTPLHIAADSGNAAIVKLLLDTGIAIHPVEAISGKVPMQLAIEKGHNHLMPVFMIATQAKGPAGREELEKVLRIIEQQADKEIVGQANSEQMHHLREARRYANLASASLATEQHARPAAAAVPKSSSKGNPLLQAAENAMKNLNDLLIAIEANNAPIVRRLLQESVVRETLKMLLADPTTEGGARGWRVINSNKLSPEVVALLAQYKIPKNVEAKPATAPASEPAGITEAEIAIQDQLFLQQLASDMAQLKKANLDEQTLIKKLTTMQDVILRNSLFPEAVRNRQLEYFNMAMRGGFGCAVRHGKIIKVAGDIVTDIPILVAKKPDAASSSASKSSKEEQELVKNADALKWKIADLLTAIETDTVSEVRNLLSDPLIKKTLIVILDSQIDDPTCRHARSVINSSKVSHEVAELLAQYGVPRNAVAKPAAAGKEEKKAKKPAVAALSDEEKVRARLDQNLQALKGQSKEQWQKALTEMRGTITGMPEHIREGYLRYFYSRLGEFGYEWNSKNKKIRLLAEVDKPAAALVPAPVPAAPKPPIRIGSTVIESKAAAKLSTVEKAPLPPEPFYKKQVLLTHFVNCLAGGDEDNNIVARIVKSCTELEDKIEVLEDFLKGEKPSVLKSQKDNMELLCKLRDGENPSTENFIRFMTQYNDGLKNKENIQTITKEHIKDAIKALAQEQLDILKPKSSAIAVPLASISQREKLEAEAVAQRAGDSPAVPAAAGAGAWHVESGKKGGGNQCRP